MAKGFVTPKVVALKVDVDTTAAGNIARTGDTAVGSKALTLNGFKADGKLADANTVFTKVLGNIAGASFDTSTALKTTMRSVDEIAEKYPRDFDDNGNPMPVRFPGENGFSVVEMHGTGAPVTKNIIYALDTKSDGDISVVRTDTDSRVQTEVEIKGRKVYIALTFANSFTAKFTVNVAETDEYKATSEAFEVDGVYAVDSQPVEV